MITAKKILCRCTLWIKGNKESKSGKIANKLNPITNFLSSFGNKASKINKGIIICNIGSI